MNQNYKEKLCDLLISLTHIMKRLRSDNGCPWDRKQTEESIKTYLLEETCEVMDAIEKNDYKGMCEELGDLFFMIIFLSQIATEKNQFTLLDVFQNIKDKMIRRHPHVFGNKKLKDAKQVADNWAKIKMEEKRESADNILNKVPSTLPALLRAHRISEKAAQFGFDWKDKNDVWDKVKEEFFELEDALSDRDNNKAKEEIGDLIFSLVNLARHLGFNGEDILRDTNKKFINRFNKMANKFKEKGLDIKQAAIEEMDEVWERIKKDD